MPLLTTPHARRWLSWCLVALLPWLGLGIAQRQALGPLHVHAAPGAAELQPGVDLVRAALAWWWAQVQAQADARQHARAHATGQDHGHAQRPTAAKAEGRADGHAHEHAEAGVHAHDAWQRHHHGGDASVIALDAAGDGQGSPGAGASLLVPVLGGPQDGLHIAACTALTRAWPRPGGARFSSWGAAPPLPPPRG